MNDRDLRRRRDAALAPAYSLFYDRPLHLVRGEGVWLFDADGRRYLDAYNNVPSVGHCHPRVVAALAAQASTLNTHTRYLHESVVELAERIGESLGGDLGACWFVCTGTEANDLAVQIARSVSGRHGVVVSEHSYHGNSELVAALSTDGYAADARPDWLGVVEPPNVYRGPFRGDGPEVVDGYVSSMSEAVEGLGERGHGVAAWLVDPSWDSNGVLIAPEGYVARSAEIVRRAGGLVIADEVQAGYCRLGGHFWGHMHHGLVPDIVTMGKPMGAGHPVAAVVTTQEIAETFAERRSYFNTFGGNPVSAAVALAVLDVIEDEQLPAHVDETGALLRAGLGGLAARHELIGNVQGSGLFWGLDLVADPATRQPIAYDDAKRIATDLAGRGVLIGITGRHTNVLKIRPPLVFGSDEADELLGVLDTYFDTFVPRGGTARRKPGYEW